MNLRSVFCRVESFVLAVIMVLLAAAGGAGTARAADTLLVPEQRTYDGRFRDMNGLWCADAVKTCFDTGLLEGRQADRFDAVSELTNAQILVISARLYDRLTGGSGLSAPAAGEAWYQSALTLLSGLPTDTARSAAARSVLQAWGDSAVTAYPQQPCTRNDFAALLLLVLDNAHVTLTEINTLERDVPDLTAGRAVYELYLSGVLNGVDQYGTFDGQRTVTRGQAAAMLARLVDPAQRLKLSFKSFSQCRDVLGVDPAAVLLTVDGADFTAEDCSGTLCQGLRKQYDHLIVNGNQDVSAALAYLEKTVKLYAAREALAASLNLAVTDAEVDQRGPFRDGYQGQPAKSLRTEAQQTLLAEKLLAYYEAQYGAEAMSPGMGAASAGQEQLNTALDKLCGAMTVQRSGTLNSLDLQVVQTRLVKAPGSVGAGYDPYR